MKRTYMVVCCLAAAGLTSMMSSATASALPEFFPASNKFTGKATSPSTLKPALKTGGTTVTCNNDTNTGEISNSTEMKKFLVTFTGCKSSGINCNTKISAAEEALYGKEEVGKIVTKELSGVLGYANKSLAGVGIGLLPASGKILAEFECSGSIKIVVEGTVVGAITPTNKSTKTFQLTFNEVGGKQELTTYESCPTEEEKTASLLTRINGGGAVASTQMSEDTLTLEAGKEAEIIA